MVTNEVKFKQEEEEEQVEPLTMENFIFPLIILAGGLVISFLIFIVEIIIKRCQRNDQL